MLKEDIRELRRIEKVCMEKHTKILDYAKKTITKSTGADILGFEVELNTKDLQLIVKFKDTNPSSRDIKKIRDEFGAYDDKLRKDNTIYFEFK